MNIPGMTYPVEVYNLDDLPHLMGRFFLPPSRPAHGSSLDEEDVDIDLTVSVIIWVSQVFAQGDGAILCFLPVSFHLFLGISFRFCLFVMMVLILMRVETHLTEYVLDKNLVSTSYLMRQMSCFVLLWWNFQGWDTISVVRDRLLKVRASRFMMIVPLHSQLPAGEQRAAFARAPSGMRKVIIFSLLICDYLQPTWSTQRFPSQEQILTCFMLSKTLACLNVTFIYWLTTLFNSKVLIRSEVYLYRLF